MGQTILYVEKDTDIMRSTFIAYGLAQFLERLGDAQRITARIQDRGGAYVIIADTNADELIAYAEKNGLPSLLPAIHKPLSTKEKARLEAGVPEDEILRRYVPVGFNATRVDYGAEKHRADQASKAGRDKTVREEGDVPQASPDYPVWAHLCSYFGKGSAMRTGYPLVVHAWHAHQGEYAPQLVEFILNLYGDFPAALDEGADYWAKEIKPALGYEDFDQFKWGGKEANISALSIVSPTTAQGSYTNSAARLINTGTPEIFWLEIYFAFAGYMATAMPFRGNGGDVLLYYPLPHNISYRMAADILATFRNDADVRTLYNRSGILPRAKIDAQAEIKFYQAMLRHLRDNEGLDDEDIDMISGLIGYYYKDISTQIPFDQVTFAVPGWLPQKPTTGQLQTAITLLDAHYKIITSIRGEYAEELIIINDYRRFASQGKAEDWIQFAIHYGEHYFKKMVDSGWLRNLQLVDFEMTLNGIAEGGNMSDKKDYSEILNNPGFRNIAQAINECTTRLRFWKDVRKSGTAFKVRHGLGNDLRRHAHNPDRFVDALSDFVYDYQLESSNVEVNTGATRQWITDEDLQQLLDLVSKYGSRTVANLLVAVGYTQRPLKSTENTKEQ